jgi:hypothetical protein
MLILQPIPGLRIVGRPVGMKNPPARRLTLSELEETIVSPKVIAALREASRRLTAADVRHVVIGALAVGVHGWPRATRDVDLLLGPEAWTTHPSGAQTPNLALDETIDGIGIDHLPIDIATEFLTLGFEQALKNEGVPIAPIEVVIVTKLIRLAMRDQADIVELVKARTFDPDGVMRYLELHTPMLSRRFQALVDQAKLELER